MNLYSIHGSLALAWLALGCSSTPASIDRGVDPHLDGGDGQATDAEVRDGAKPDSPRTMSDGGQRPASDGGETDICSTAPASKVRLPADDAQHNDQMEWWYWTGHLKAPDGGAYGFEEVFFRTETAGIVGQLVNVALTDVGEKRFRYSSGIAAGPPVAVADGFTLSVAANTAGGGNGHDSLHGAPQDATFDLTLDSQKAPVPEYGSGFASSSDGSWTYYYSRMLIGVTGSVFLNGQTLPVTGEAWFDHQWGQLATTVTKGWEWFSIQLDDGRDMMLNFPLVNRVPGAGAGTLSDATCHDTTIGAGDVTMTSVGTWKSPTTGCTYPMGWKVNYKGLALTITADVNDQELSGTGGPTYWEGASTVSGDATGKAYVELNGFCP